MQELLKIQTADFELSIKCNDISKRQLTHQKFLAKRHGKDYSPQLPIIKFSPSLYVTEASFMGKPMNIKSGSLIKELELPGFIFFENIQYFFKWLFINYTDFEKQTLNNQGNIQVEEAYLTHRKHEINTSFDFNKSKYSMPAYLFGNIHTANDVGWLQLPLKYLKSSKKCQSNLSFEVLPTKMSLHEDLPAMYEAIDSVFPLWRFSLVRNTEQDVSHDKRRNSFPLLWLANFSNLRLQLEHALKVINQAPHSRLQANSSYNKAARIKGKLPIKLGEKIKEDFESGRYEQRYKITKKQLSVDTPENQFIKMVVSSTKKRLADFEHKLRQSNDNRNKQRLSEAFLEELYQWQQPLQKTLKQGFMTDVGDYNGRSRESLVLQQKIGYSSVYRIWQELKFYLDIFDNQSSISMKSVAEIYEVWCFLTLRSLLINKLGFTEVAANKQELKIKNFFEYQLEDGFAGAFKFERDDGVIVRLAHEQSFKVLENDNQRFKNHIYSYTVDQRPDIVLEATFPNDKRFIWLFDAKYRIENIKSNNSMDIDFVPSDAINQMHRYRDALIRIQHDNNSDAPLEKLIKSRPVFGAFALYPGFFNQNTTKNPYLESIDEIGIGAFALLPRAVQTDSDSEHYWLLDFLTQKLGGNPTVSNSKGSKEVNSTAINYQIDNKVKGKDSFNANQMAEHLYLESGARIPYSGMEQVLYPDLVMTIALGKEEEREPIYFENFKEGLAKWYHVPQSTFLDKYKQYIINEIRYLALAIKSEQEPNTKHISTLWPIKNVSLKSRYTINKEQSGKTSDLSDPYYLFELGKPLTLKDTINDVSSDSFTESMKLTTLSYLEKASKFSELQSVYADAFKNN